MSQMMFYFRVQFQAALFFCCLASSAYADDFSDGLRFDFNKNYVQAAASYQKAAENNNADAKFKLALMCEEGHTLSFQVFQKTAIAPTKCNPKSSPPFKKSTIERI